MGESARKFVDEFYLIGGKLPCCAGCDWWRFFNSMVGECTKSAPVSAAERWSMMDMTSISCGSDAGHIITKRDHSCGDFIDTHDWKIK